MVSGAKQTFGAVINFIGRSSKRIAVSVVGGALVLGGIVGLVFPVLPGWLLLIPGLAILATEYVWARRVLNFTKDKATEAKKRAGGLLRRRRSKT